MFSMAIKCDHRRYFLWKIVVLDELLNFPEIFRVQAIAAMIKADRRVSVT